MNHDTEPDYPSIATQLDALLAGEHDLLANTANFVAVLWNALPRINWLGVYVARGDELVLGPFQGRPACTRIPFGKGVCGSAAADGRIRRVADVHQFEGHIVCDPESRSELVVPLKLNGELFGVLDIDSPLPSRFDESDQQGVSALCDVFVKRIAAGSSRSL